MKKTIYPAVLLSAALVLTSCGTDGNTAEDTVTEITDVTSAVTSSETVSEIPAETSAAVSETTAEAVSETAVSESVTVTETSVSETKAEASPSADNSSGNSSENNQSASSQETEAPAPEQDNGDVTITLNGSSAECSSQRVSVNGSEITIKEEGTFRISGSLNGIIVVAAPKDAKVDIELNNAEINNPSGPAIRVDTADKVKIISAGGSSNHLSDGGSSEACIFSKEDLTLKGDGFIKINGNVKNGVYSKNTLKITGGSFEIFSQNNGLVGKDKVAIEAGSVNINCARDGIKATNENESGKGTVSVTGGNIYIESGDDAIQAISGVTVNSCSITAKIQGRKVNCNGEVNVDDGCINKIKE